MGLSYTVSEINFQSKSQIFPTRMYFVHLLMGFPLKLGIGTRRQITNMMGLPDG